MPLILAIEPDRQQANQLTGMVRERLRAELAIAASAEAALAELGDRVPDLILTSALLSAKDEAALARRLRAWDAAAAHVQTLTIPVLDTPGPRAGRGVLFALRGDRVSSPAAPDGCDPAVFAEQCAAYLERAAAEREQETVDASVEQPAAVAPEIAVSEEQPAVEEEAAPQEVVTPAEPLPAAEATVSAAAPSAPPPAETVDDSVEIDLSSMLDETVVRQLSEAIETVTRNSIRLQTSETPRTEAWTPSSLGAPAAWPSMDFTSAEKPQHSPAATSHPPAARFPDRKPIQDEWGFFDPAQCGFSALLAKLDEITHVASSLPAPDPAAGSPDVTR